jgi:hypothetical protein
MSERPDGDKVGTDKPKSTEKPIEIPLNKIEAVEKYADGYSMGRWTDGSFTMDDGKGTWAKWSDEKVNWVNSATGETMPIEWANWHHPVSFEGSPIPLGPTIPGE